jgi:cytochrome c556
MTLSRALKQIRDVAVIILLASLIVLANRAYYVLDDVEKTSAQARETLAQAKETLVTVDKSVSDTSRMVNANLIHADLILGRAERVSRRQEAYWDMMALKSARLLDNANKVVVDLDANQNAITTESVASLKELQRSIVLLGEAAQHTDQSINGPEIKQILGNVNAGTAQLAASAAHVEATTKDVQDQVHSITHPKIATKIATWTLRVVHAVGSWF